MPMPMTKARARELARQSRRYGYSNLGHDAAANATKVSVACPQCRARVVGYVSQYSAVNTPAKAIDDAMIEHLLHDCEAA